MRCSSVLAAFLGCAAIAWGNPLLDVPLVVGDPPVIDGSLDDEAWELATRFDDFTQVEPNEGAAPSERTEVLLFRTADSLYIGTKCFDRETNKILARDRRRDSSGKGDERLRIVIDPFGRGTDGYFFGIAAGGSWGDGILREGLGPEMDWDSIWFAKTSVTDEGWFVEVEIPFRSIGFDRNQSTWGFNIERVIRRREEVVRLSSPTRDRILFALEGAGKIGNMEDLQTGLGLDLRSTLVSRWRESEGTFDFEPSFDAFYRVTPSLTATATWRTDFAETEVDARRVNTSRFPLFFPEKRTFFLEDARYFRFGGIGRSPLPFHSRTIGLSSDGERVPITFGGKLAGKVGRLNLGVLGVGLESKDEVEADEVYATRMSYDLFEESRIGGIMTEGDPRGNGNARTYGLDFHLKDSTFLGSSKTAELVGWSMFTEGENGNDYGWGIKAVYPNNPLWAQVELQRIGEDLDPAMGFVSRPGIYALSSLLTYGIYPESSLWNEITFNLSSGMDTDLHWNSLSEQVEFTTSFEFEGGGGFNVGGVYERDRFLEDFEISDGVIVPTGDYAYSRVFAGFDTPSTNKLQFSGAVSTGEYLGGRRHGLDAQVVLKPNPLWAARIGTSSAWYDLPGGDFKTVIVNGAVQVTPTPNVLLTTDIQYDNVSEEMGINARLRWIVRPGSDVYLVFNQSLGRVGKDRRFESIDREAVAKIGWTTRF